jgi:hypothetical protein
MPRSRAPNIPWIEHLYNTFSFIVQNAEFDSITSHENIPHLNADPKMVASLIYSRLSELKEQKSVNIVPLPILEIPILDDHRQTTENEKIAEKHQATFLIGGRMVFREGILEYYSFSICIVFATIDYYRPPFGKTINRESCCLGPCKDNKRIVRRIHFDFQPKDHPKNPYHMQIGGEFPNNERNYQNLHYCFEHFLGRPRLPYEKIDFVRLLDYMIREFNTPLIKWRKDPQWKKLVGESNNLLNGLANN